MRYCSRIHVAVECTYFPSRVVSGAGACVDRGVLFIDFEICGVGAVHQPVAGHAAKAERTSSPVFLAPPLLPFTSKHCSLEQSCRRWLDTAATREKLTRAMVSWLPSSSSRGPVHMKRVVWFLLTSKLCSHDKGGREDREVCH